MGRPLNGKLVPLGEYVHFKVAAKDREAVGKLGPRWREGVWLGVRSDCGEVYVGARSGVVLTRSVRRREPSQRWNRQALDGARGTPWDTSNLADRPPRHAAPAPGRAFRGGNQAPHVRQGATTAKVRERPGGIPRSRGVRRGKDATEDSVGAAT